MDKMLPENRGEAKVIAKACAWADRRKAAAIAPAGNAKARAVGRYEVSGNELAEAVEKFRKQGGQP